MKLTEKYTDRAYIVFCDNRRSIALSDNKGGKSSYYGENANRNQLACYRIDAGIMRNMPEKQCDYGLYNMNSDTVRFIELKGSDCSQAIKQIKNSITHILDQSISGVTKIYGRVILSKRRVPQIKSTEEQRLEKFLKGKGGDLLIQTRQMREHID